MKVHYKRMAYFIKAKVLNITHCIKINLKCVCVNVCTNMSMSGGMYTRVRAQEYACSCVSMHV